MKLQLNKSNFVLSFAFATLISIFSGLGVVPTLKGEFVKNQDIENGSWIFIFGWVFLFISFYAALAFFRIKKYDVICPSCEHIEEVPENDSKDIYCPKCGVKMVPLDGFYVK